MPPAQQATDTSGTLTDAAFLPGGDTRLEGSQQAVDQAQAGVSGAPNLADESFGYGDRYRSLFGTGNVGFDPTQTNADYTRVDPNVGYDPQQTDVARASINPNVSPGQGVDPFAESDRLKSLGTAEDSALSGLNTGQTRYEAALDQLKNLDAQQGRERTSGVRQIGQAAAALGRTGAGMTTNDLTDLETRLNQQREESLRQLAADTTEGDINDRFRRLDAASGLRGQEEGIASGRRSQAEGQRQFNTGVAERNVGRAEDEAAAQTGLQERNLGRRTDQAQFTTGLNERNQGRAVNERDTALGLTERNLGRAADERNARVAQGNRNSDTAFDRARTAAGMGSDLASTTSADRYRRLGALQDVENQQVGEGQANRNEYRTERGYQQGVGQQGFENQLQLHQQENADQQLAYERALNEARLASGNPLYGQSTALNSYDQDSQAAAQASQQAAFERELARRRAAGGAQPVQQYPSYYDGSSTGYGGGVYG